MRISLRVKMLLMSFIIVITSVTTIGWNMVNNVTDAFEKEIGERAVAIARTVAQMPDIRQQVGMEGGATEIQLIAERTRKATNVDYIVIIDMNSIRYSHPNEQLIGKRFVGGDESEALANREYVSIAQGTLGNATRAFVPIMDEEEAEQVGVAVVGILTPTLQAIIATYSQDIFIALIWGLLIGLVGSYLLARSIKKQTFGLEPYEIARLVEERSAVMQAMDIGIVAVDEQGQITFMNRLAKTYLKSEERNFLMHLQDVFPQSWEAIGQKEQINRNVVFLDKNYLISTYPIHVKAIYAGTLVTMIDRTDATRLAEELTGVKVLVDGLRAQNHEYMNKLHSIAGLIQLDRTEDALDIIMDESVDEESIILFLKERFKDYAISGLLLGKRSRAKELGITLLIDQNSYLTEIYGSLSSGDLVTIIGNLIENAFESFENGADEKTVECLIEIDKRHLMISVRDNGRGMTKELQGKIFTYGFSTKGKEGRGIGLALVHQIVSAHHGKLKVESEVGLGTEMIIEARKEGEMND
ncbi:ATP-binding protein [Halalkalibacter akibai]|uniref:histidine kinase n=1 Tax=Halalkalibacter akibai (strain ATCC 43226 / DSM 21942 / CIP 109018 / JCM 9157 / 1139) TaxID=1236973 RepID=W4QVJ5_HALA3|nr:sensor histidine kinase [Halalkalibacter akibai]GAE36116.1 signal transduction histidine kinase [Halalkalibacter akibai JCM 9157]